MKPGCPWQGTCNGKALVLLSLKSSIWHRHWSLLLSPWGCTGCMSWFVGPQCHARLVSSCPEIVRLWESAFYRESYFTTRLQSGSCVLSLHRCFWHLLVFSELELRVATHKHCFQQLCALYTCLQANLMEAFSRLRFFSPDDVDIKIFWYI